MTSTNLPRLAFIGFGEAGQAFAAGLREEGVRYIAAWDILFPEPAGIRLTDAAARIGVRIATSAADAVGGADWVISAVTAASSLDAAQSVKRHINDRQIYLDINSVSPGRKQETAILLNGLAHYVDVAVMAPVHPARHATPLLLAGPHADALLPSLAALGMSASLAGAEVGNAASIKMVRSVMVKGLEALTMECFAAAARAGVVDQILASLGKSYPGLDWPRMAAYVVERMASHGTRRAAEMDEVADTLRELRIAPLIAGATAERQRQMGRLGKDPALQAALGGELPELLHALLTTLDNDTTSA